MKGFVSSVTAIVLISLLLGFGAHSSERTM